MGKDRRGLTAQRAEKASRGRRSGLKGKPPPAATGPALLTALFLLLIPAAVALLVLAMEWFAGRMAG